jgi:dTMP kinase
MIIAFEGGEGSGKGTQIQLLKKVLLAKKVKVLDIIEPGGTKEGEAIRAVTLDRKDLKLTAKAETLLFYASRAQQVETVTRPLLAEGKIILSDRSYFSTYAYQGYGRELDLRSLEYLTLFVVGYTIPDLVILLDVPPEVGLARKKQQNKMNRLDVETLAFHKRVRNGYLELAKMPGPLWRIIDATASVEEIHRQVVEHVFWRLNLS